VAGDPYTIRIFVPDGDPEGVRIIDQLNWTGKGIVFPRSRWVDTRRRSELESAGVYILIGEGNSDDDDLPIVYVGEGDGIRDRIDTHEKTKEFWSWGVAFVSTSRALNKAHVQWLEYAIVDQARRAQRCKLDNSNVPKAPELTESETADTKGFLKEVLQILPLVGLRAFEMPKPVAVATAPARSDGSAVPVDALIQNLRDATASIQDTVIVPAREEGFKHVFMEQDCWYAIRISGGALSRIKWIAAYRTTPVSAITHYAPVASIEPYGDGTKYKLNFAEKAQALKSPIVFGDATTGTMQGTRYTSIKKLLSAKKVSELF